MNDIGFCQRNLTPVYALLVALSAITVVWVFVPGDGKERGPFGRPASGAVERGRRAPERPTPPRVQPTAPPVAPSRPPPVDATSVATPGGGIRVIALAQRPGPVATAPARAASRTAFNTVAADVLPAVVSVRARRSQGPGAQASETLGSGFVIDGRGFVLTNEHVVTQAASLTVGVSGPTRAEYAAIVVAIDRKLDLALLRMVGAPPLPEVRLGDSGSARVGDWILAFGSPFGLDQSVTEGIVSARRRSVFANGVFYGEMLQTDAPINRGSSGGPLVNLDSQVIGMNTAIFGPQGAFSGAGFAIPVDRLKVFLARSASALTQ